MGTRVTFAASLTNDCAPGAQREPGPAAATSRGPGLVTRWTVPGDGSGAATRVCRVWVLEGG
jgi:hypothetical protein